jgi:hypothetical protein
MIWPAKLAGILGAAAGAPVADLFVIVGQSNAEGRGTSASSPASPTGIAVSTSGVITEPLADPVGGASTGSMWPAFANAWNASTGRHAAICEAATGGTALLPDQAGSNWSPSGSLRAAAVSAANAAIAAIDASAYTLGNVYFVWCQGEQDATTINGTTITGPLYNTALQALAAYFKAQVPSMASMAVIQSGGEFDATDEPGYAAIRQAQDDACTASADLVMVYRGAYSFAARAWMGDNVHWSQPGLNVAGTAAARALDAGGASAPAAAPAVLAATPYIDTVYTATVGRSVTHTAATGTKTLVVALSILRPESNTTFLSTGVTFGGVPMTLVRIERASQSTSPAGRATAAIYYLTETAYGSSLSGASAAIDVSVAVSSNIISWAVLDLDAEVVPEAFYSSGPTNVTTDTGSLNVTTSAPALVVGVGSLVASSTTPLTATLTNLTEVADGGASNGTTRSGQTVVGHAAETAAVLQKTYSATWTAAGSGLAWVVAAFRQVIDGE